MRHCAQMYTGSMEKKTKKSKIVPIVIVLAILLLGAGGWFAWSKLQSPTGVADLMSNAKNESNGLLDSFSGSITDLVKKGVNVTCTFEQSDESGKTNGTVYVAGDKFSGEFTHVDSEQVASTTNLIRDQEYMYTWTKTRQGMMAIKMKLEDYEVSGEVPEAPAAEPNAKATIDWDPQATYSCKPWIPDNAKFTVPSDINFTDVGEQMKTIQDQANTLRQDQCGACEQLSGEMKAACLVQLGC